MIAQQFTGRDVGNVEMRGDQCALSSLARTRRRDHQYTHTQLQTSSSRPPGAQQNGATISVLRRSNRAAWMWSLEEVLRRLHFAVEDLASGAFGQFADEPDMARVFIRRHPLPGERAQFRGRGGGPGLELHGGADFLAEFGMRDSDHGYLSDGLMFVEDLLEHQAVAEIG